MARVLVVDDEDVLLEMIAALIEDLGYESLIATSGNDALELLHASTDPPALVISDVMMPKMNGIELTQRNRANERFAGVPLVLMSAGGRPPNTQNADYFLHKPFSIDHLAEIIMQLVDSRAP